MGWSQNHSFSIVAFSFMDIKIIFMDIKAMLRCLIYAPLYLKVIMEQKELVYSYIT